MQVKILASGSSGNCIWIRSEVSGTAILIDCGLPKTKIEKVMLDKGIRADEINGIFITHAHGDHIKGLPLAVKYSIPVVAGEGEWKDILKKIDIEWASRRLATAGETWFCTNSKFCLRVTPFRTHHDALEPLGYTVEDQEMKVSICLDTGKVDDDMLESMAGSDVYIIEANHDPEIVQYSDYPNSVKARILSDVGHLSNMQTAEALNHLLKRKAERVYLTHLSSNNNDPSIALATINRVLRNHGLVQGTDYIMKVV